MRRYIAVEEAEVWDETEDFNGVDIESAMEQAEVMEEEARELAAEITADNAEAERAADLSDSLEDLAVVASSIDEATPAETQLIQLAGDMATAGDEEVTTEDIVPATESFVGQRIAVEGFVEKAKQIWEAIKKYLKDLWAKVEKFFYNIAGAIPRVRMQVKVLRYRMGEVQDAGKSLDKDGEKFELSSGLESLKVDEKVATSFGEVMEAFDASVKAGKELFKSKEIAKFGQSIAKAIGNYDPETAAAAGEKLNEVVSSVLNKPITLGKLSGVNRFSKDYDVFGVTGCLGGKAFIARIRQGLMNAKTPLENAEILRSYRVEFTTLADKKVKAPASVKFETLTFEQIDKALIAVADALNMLETFHRGSCRKDMLAAAKEVVKACDKVEAQQATPEKLSATDEATMIACQRAVYKMNMMYGSIVSTSTTQGYQLLLTNCRTVMMLVSRSLGQYKDEAK